MFVSNPVRVKVTCDSLRLKPDRKGATGRKKRAGIAWD